MLIEEVVLEVRIENEVYVIKGLIENKIFSLSYISTIFDVSISLISQIKSNKIWKHLEEV